MKKEKLEIFTDRDLSWIKFNDRVLDQSMRNIPLAEKLLFIGITADNLDEFLMSRYVRRTDGLDTYEEGVKENEDIVSNIEYNHTDTYNAFVEILNKDPVIITYKNIKGKKLKGLMEELFNKSIGPIIYPLAVGKSLDPRSNEMNIFIELLDDDKERKFSNISIPSSIKQFWWIEELSGYISVEDIIICNLENIFSGMTIVDYCVYKVTRSINMIIHGENETLFKTIEKSLKKLKDNKITSIQCTRPLDKKGIGKQLLKKLNDKTDEFTVQLPATGMVGLSRLKGLGDKHFVETNRFRVNARYSNFPQNDVFKSIKESDILVYHPFESFDRSVVKFIETASEDPDVKSIKMTLYRIPKDSKIISALLKARTLGKSVVVMVELKARFNEQDNLIISNILRESGVDIIYSDEYFKTHAKMCVVTRQEGDKIRYYSHVGTGNYSEVNSKVYTDYSFFTADSATGKDLTKFFNLLSNPGIKPFKSKSVVYAPFNLRDTIKDKINEQIKLGKKGYILMKCNSMTDPEIVQKLYDASKVGVRVDLIVRGACILKPQVKHLSDNIRLTSIVGKYLEHSRVYVFGTKKQEVFIGSSDIMFRNLNRRYELLISIENEDLKERILKHMKFYLKDDVNTYTLDGDRYKKVKTKDFFNSHRKLESEAKKRGV